MKGERNLTYESIQKFAGAMKLNNRERDYFETLVFYNQSKSPQEKVKYFKKMMAFREFRDASSLTKNHLEYFSKWYYPAIREMVNMDEFVSEPEWIANQLRPSITPSEAEVALEILEKLNLIKKDEKGRWVQAEKHVAMGGEMGAMNAVMFHQEMIRLGSECLKDPAHEREVSSMTMSVSEPQFQHIKERIEQFEKEIRELISKNGSDSKVDRICQLNFQLFHLSETERRGSDEKQDA